VSVLSSNYDTKKFDVDVGDIKKKVYLH